MTSPTLADLTPEERVLHRLKHDNPYWSLHCGKISNKQGKIIPFALNEGQLALDAKLEAQRLNGKPQRAIILKARQLGYSTYAQGKLIQRATQRENHHAVVVAHDRETGGKLFAAGDRFWRYLPDEAGLKPPKYSHRRARFLHFGEEKDGGLIYPDSTYLVDTANEFEAGRGATYHSVHGSELAFYADALSKYTALMQAVPDDPDTLVIWESTANGSNLFKDLWDDAVEGRSEYVAHFWAWHQHGEYQLGFANESERERFRVGEGPFGEEEPRLVELFGLSLEQLNWRRHTIANKLAGKLDRFRSEYPSTPEDAFIATGRQVFDQNIVQSILIDVELNYDPRQPSEQQPGPELAKLIAGDKRVQEGALGRIEVPINPVWVPRSKLPMGEDADWKIWEKPQEEDQYVIGVDVSGGENAGPHTDELARDAIQIINHKTRIQAAEFSARLDSDLLAEQLYLACLTYNFPWVLIEITGSWGRPVARKLLDFKYPFLYRRKKLSGTWDRQEDTLGWDTNRATKPLLESNYAEMLREGTHGIRSRELVLQLKTHVRDAKGRSGPEAGKFNDRFMAHAIAQFGANLLPIKRTTKRFKGGYTPRDDVTGYGFMPPLFLLASLLDKF